MTANDCDSRPGLTAPIFLTLVKSLACEVINSCDKHLLAICYTPGIMLEAKVSHIDEKDSFPVFILASKLFCD